LKSAIKAISIFILVVLLVACGSTRRLKPGEVLLVSNQVKITNPARDISSGTLQGFIVQKPNNKFLGIVPFKLWYNSVFPKRGEPPVVLDLSTITESKLKIGKYLASVGYFDSKVTDTIKYKKNKAKKVTYLVTLSVPYRIRQINSRITDKSIEYLFLLNKEESLLKTGEIFNTYRMDEERDRLASVLNTNGYFAFSKDYIYFEVDSTHKTREIDLTLIVKKVIQPPTQPNQPPQEVNHKVYYIKNVNIYPNYRTLQTDTIVPDTIVERVERKGDTLMHLYNIIYAPPLKIKPKILTRSIFVEKDDKYNSVDAQQTYKKLSDLRIYKHITVNFKEADERVEDGELKNYLDCNIQMTRQPVHSYSIEAQGTNSGGDLGVGGYLVYQNKNLFRAGEVFNLRLKGALEAQDGGSTASEVESGKVLFFNTYEAGIDANLSIPKFLAPLNQDIFSRYFRPKTNINIGYNYQDRLEYRRTITNVSFSYEWAETKTKSHILFPADINLVKVNTTEYFDSVLSQESERYKNQYTDHLIVGLKYSYIYNNQELNKLKNFFYFRGNIESSGNLLALVHNLSGSQSNEDGYRTIFGIRYSQYIKSDFDFRYYIMKSKSHHIAMRAAFGIAIPYGNSVDIPFEKGFYGGGANGMRAWPLRYLGPGAYQNTNPDIERVGDFMVEGNIEYRFSIFSIFKGALFYDIGNIWYLKENETFPGGELSAAEFPGELAMDAGVALRLDFNYFIFRIDVAQRVKDPAYPQGDRWVIGRDNNWFQPVFNLGIGYPF
jgi:outer membrane translocation and assembly module TamA